MGVTEGAPYLPRARPIFPSPFPFLAPATQARGWVVLGGGGLAPYKRTGLHVGVLFG